PESSEGRGPGRPGTEFRSRARRRLQAPGPLNEGEDCLKGQGAPDTGPTTIAAPHPGPAPAVPPSPPTITPGLRPTIIFAHLYNYSHLSVASTRPSPRSSRPLRAPCSTVGVLRSRTA